MDVLAYDPYPAKDVDFIYTEFFMCIIQTALLQPCDKDGGRAYCWHTGEGEIMAERQRNEPSPHTAIS